ncbi:MAG: hypothetical protein ACKOSS_04065 [Planctomycetia bacterium]
MSAPATWPAAAQQLATRVTRRERAGALLLRLGVALCAGAALGLLLRSLGVAVPAAAAPLAGLLAGLLLGLRAAGRVRPVAPGHAAWALDEAAQAHGAGLAASERAATLAPVPRPPAVRLAPLEGLPACVAGLLLAALCVALPAAPAAAQGPATPDDDRALRVVGTLEAGAAAHAAAQAAEGERVRAALGLAPGSEPSAAALAELLGDPALRAAARARTDAGSAAAAALGGPEAAASAAALAQALAGAQAGARALAQARRAEAARGAAPGSASVPPSRRALVARYLDARAGGEGRR